MPIVTDGLIGYWNSKQGVNGSTWDNIAPATAGSYNGTITGATIQADGMYFDGVDDYSSIPTVGLSNSFTLEMWVNYNRQTATERFNLFYTEVVRQLRINSVNFLGAPESVAMYYAGGYRNSSTGLMLSGQLNHIVVTYTEGVGISFFINNNAAGNYDSTADINWDSDFRVGGAFGSNMLRGLIPAFRIYNRVLTTNEISQNYAVGSDVGIPSPPVMGSSSYDTKQLIFNNAVWNGSTRQNVFKTDFSEKDTAQIIFKPVSKQNDLRQNIYNHLQNRFTTKQEVFKQVLKSYLTEQRIMGFVSFSVKQVIYNQIEKEQVIRQIIYKASSRNFATKQTIFKTISLLQELRQVIYKNQSIRPQTQQVIYKSVKKDIRTLQQMYETGLIDYQTLIQITEGYKEYKQIFKQELMIFRKMKYSVRVDPINKRMFVNIHRKNRMDIKI